VPDRLISAFERRHNRLRFMALLAIATIIYLLTALAVGLTTALALVAPGLVYGLVWPYIFVGIIAACVVIALVAALIRLPLARRRIEKAVMDETGARLIEPDRMPRIRNLLNGLAIAAGVPPPRFAVVDDPSLNSFSVGTRPDETIVAVTTGLIDELRRDELEAILAYEVSRIASLDVALATWIVAITHDAIESVKKHGERFVRRSTRVFARVAMRIQVWALRGQARLRDRQALRFTRNPAALVRAFEALHAHEFEVGRVTRATAPLWIEFPASALGSDPSPVDVRLLEELDLGDRIDELHALIGQPSMRA
jgi:heat shock protein HtpX